MLPAQSPLINRSTFTGLFSAILLIAIFSFLSFAEEKKKEVMVISVNSVINPVTSEFIGKSIQKANEKKAEALIIELDTPGGLDLSMREATKAILGSTVPVIVWVGPP